ncbi:hypothetical protein MLD38_024089 [Melastoma candidum]|uniref:Uncharacterized protein n=1 Tax=Melastoma candidum TaxID=119954 RepID=A0ACB9NRC1_9MYRT|nr:hypothetical protein MLD38_024089 [Melastoma candidum]
MDRRRGQQQNHHHQNRRHRGSGWNPSPASYSNSRPTSASWDRDDDPSGGRVPATARRGGFTNRYVVPGVRSVVGGHGRRGGDEGYDDDEQGKARANPDRESPLVGTCPHMCPAAEIEQRERLRDLASFERLHGNPAKTSPELAVKKFCRTISTKDVRPSDIRPIAVLERTLDYLMGLMDMSDKPFEIVHDFVFDRSRSVRQDMSMQNVVDRKAIQMYEKMAKFHVISHHKLRVSGQGSDEVIVSSWHHLNMEQMAKVLTSLYNLYDVNQLPNSLHENEAEYRSLYVLLCLGSDSLPEGETLPLWLRRVPSLVIKSKEMSFARKVLRSVRVGNYKRFFDTVAAEASYLQYCAIGPSIDKVRALALSCINTGGYKLHPYPISHLSTLLRMKESEMEAFCEACNLATSFDEHGNMVLTTKQTGFTYPKRGFEKYSFTGTDENIGR